LIKLRLLEAINAGTDEYT